MTASAQLAVQPAELGGGVAEQFLLTPPEPLVAVPSQTANSRVPLQPGKKEEIQARVDTFVSALRTLDVGSDEFKAKLDAAFKLGKEQVASAAALLQGQSLDANFVGAEDSPAYKAISEIRGLLDELNPGKDGDLMGAAHSLLGFSWGNKLKAYFRKYEAAGKQIKKAMGQVYAAHDGIGRQLADTEVQKQALWKDMQALSEAIEFAQALDQHVAALADSLRTSDPLRARALDQEVVFYARQNLTDMLTQQAVNVNGYLSFDILKKTGRELMNGCSRVATTGMSALAVAQRVARDTGNQIDVMNMLVGVGGSIGTLIETTGRQLNSHVERTAEFASNPLLGIEQIKAMFNQTYMAMDSMDNFRSKAIASMGETNRVMAGELERSREYVDRVRAELANEALA